MEMKQRPWIFKPSVLLAIVGGLTAYSFLAELLDFHLIGIRLPGASALNHRLRECMILWLVVCSVVGWTLYIFNRRPARESKAWPLVVIPLVAAFWLVASDGFDVYRDYTERSAQSHPSTSFWIDVGIPIAGAALPLGLWAVIAGLLAMQANSWRLPITPGRCPTCDYDLTGNQSGVCPECGSRAMLDPDNSG